MPVSLLKSFFEIRQVSTKSWVSHHIRCVLYLLPSLSSRIQTLKSLLTFSIAEILHCSPTFLPEASTYVLEMPIASHQFTPSPHEGRGHLVTGFLGRAATPLSPACAVHILPNPRACSRLCRQKGQRGALQGA